MKHSGRATAPWVRENMDVRVRRIDAQRVILTRLVWLTVLRA